MVAQGKRAGSRKGTKQKPGFQPALLLLALGMTLAVVAWGYLVFAAIDFGADARTGDSGAWLFLGLASVGAVACLFIALMLIARLLRRLGITQAPPPRERRTPSEEATPVAPSSGGHRAAR